MVKIMNKTTKIILWVLFPIITISVLVWIDGLIIDKRVPITLQQKSIETDLWVDGYVVGMGTLVEKNDDYYDELNTFKVNCYLSQKICIQSVSGLFKTKYIDYMSPILTLRHDVFKIVRWDKDVIIYQNLESCGEITFTITRDTKTFSGVKRYIKKNGCVREHNGDITYSLVDGHDLTTRIKNETRNVPRNYGILFVILLITGFGIYSSIKGGKSK
jgi:hypothetical protein